MLVGLIVTTVSMFFVDIEIHNPLLVVLVVVMTSVMFSLAGFVNAVFAKTFDDISIVPTFVLTPLTYLGGVFYSIQLLPEFWQSVSMVNPVLYMVNAFRFGFLGTSDIDITFALGLITFFIVVLASAAMYMLKRGIGIRS
jgi:ABC-2 type transport system permease protein